MNSQLFWGSQYHMCTVDEIKCVLGVLLASGVNELSQRRDYWSQNQIKNDKAVSESIGLKRFEHNFKVPTGALLSKNKFRKMRLLISKLNKKFDKFGPKSAVFSIGETMPYDGHIAKQFVHGKQLRFGFKSGALPTTTATFTTLSHSQE